MVFVSITRLRIRSIRFLPSFAIHTFGANAQVRRADGFIAGSLLPDRKRTFWTMTLWQDQAAMRRFMTSGAHLRAMPKLMQWCDEASIVHWEQSGTNLPDWQDADQRMRTEGRPSKLLNPSLNHGDLSYLAPRTSRAAPLVRA
ncbi:antibiotic biosynthesis monooxygenase [Parasphingorhabdus sp.]|uniref:antibiotic biosynthesis monooxygenase n=1 Tax=Parasphingorhabdus sp. TaxID=2709688 RepID=UPI003A8E53E5